MAKKRIIILGAGLAGLSAAWHLQRKGVECLVLEKEKEVGGLCRSKEVNGFTFDYSGHLLHFRHKYAFDFVKGLLGDNLVRHKRSAWIYSCGRCIPYPFQANLYGLPLPVRKECLQGFVEARNNGGLKKANPSFLDWINSAFGCGIAKHFMVPYNTKFWTLPPENMGCGWLDGFIPRPSLNQVIKGALEENREQFGYNVTFWYPEKGGISALPLSLARAVKNIFTAARVTEIDLKNKEVITASGNKEGYDFLVSTIPLPQLPLLIKTIPERVSSLFNKLRWNSILNINLGLGKDESALRHWVYYPQKDISFFRVGFYHNFQHGLVSKKRYSLYAEVSYSKNRKINKDSVVSDIKADLKKVGILGPGDEIQEKDANDITYGYPIYDSNYNQARKVITEYLLRHNIFPCGRYGSWRYMTMENAILDGKDVAAKIRHALNHK